MRMKDLAFTNVKNRKRAYAAHFFSSSFAVMIFFIYAILRYHPELKDGIQATSDTMATFATMGMKVSQYVIVTFSFFFIMYSVSSFLQTRKKEFGIMMMFGMTNRQLNRLLFIENMIIGFLAMTTGILAGLLFSKVFLFATAKLLMLDEGLSFFIPWKGVLFTFAVFSLVFFIISLFTSRFVRINEMVELLKGDRKPKQEPQASIFQSILALLLIGAGYILVYLFATNEAFMSLFYLVLVVVLVTIGTYFLFSQLNVFLMKRLLKNNAVLFRRTNILTIPELTYRIRDNSNMFFMIAIVSAVAFTAVGTIASVGNQEGLVKYGNPYAISYTSFAENDKEKEHLHLIEKKMENAGFADKKVTLNIKQSFNKETEESFDMISASMFNDAQQIFGGQKVNLSGNEAIFIPGSVKTDNELREVEERKTVHLEELQQDLEVIGSLNELIVPKSYFTDVLLVVADEVFEEIPIDKEMKQYFTGYIVADLFETKTVARELFQTIYPSEEEMFYGAFNFQALAQEYIVAKQMNGILLIIGLLVGVVFFVSASSFIYFRLYSDLDRDRRQYRMISKLGLTRKEMSKVLSTQLVILFFAPIIVACIHSGMAFFSLQKMVIDMSIAAPTMMVLGFFFLLQVVYFLIIRWRYVRNLQQQLV